MTFGRARRRFQTRRFQTRQAFSNKAFKLAIHLSWLLREAGNAFLSSLPSAAQQCQTSIACGVCASRFGRQRIGEARTDRGDTEEPEPVARFQHEACPFASAGFVGKEAGKETGDTRSAEIPVYSGGGWRLRVACAAVVHDNLSR